MKFLSDDGKIYETLEACKAADERFKKINTEKAQQDKDKKIASTRVHQARINKEAAEKKWEEACIKASEIQKKATEEMNSILHKASVERDRTRTAYAKEVEAFEERFGTSKNSENRDFIETLVKIFEQF